MQLLRHTIHLMWEIKIFIIFLCVYNNQIITLLPIFSFLVSGNATDLCRSVKYTNDINARILPYSTGAERVCSSVYWSPVTFMTAHSPACPPVPSGLFRSPIKCYVCPHFPHPISATLLKHPQNVSRKQVWISLHVQGLNVV